MKSLTRKIRVMIADDSALMRRLLKDIFNSNRQMEVIEAARDGEDLLAKARANRPDVITLDINMPRMDGITALKILMEERIAPVIMVSSLTQKGADITLQALELGAFDYVGKPGGTVTADMSSVKLDLLQKVRAAAEFGRQAMDTATRKKNRGHTRHITGRKEQATIIHPVDSGFKAVAIGISTGGPKTIFDVLPKLPPDLPAAIFMVQHLPANFTASFAARLNHVCPMRCVEANSGMVVQPGTIYLGKGGCQFAVRAKKQGEVVIRTPSRPIHTFMPSVDVMMESVVMTFGRNTIGVLMTGMGDDGARSMGLINDAGGVTIAESEESAVVWGMPGAAVARNAVQIEAASWEIADLIVEAVNS